MYSILYLQLGSRYTRLSIALSMPFNKEIKYIIWMENSGWHIALGIHTTYKGL